MAVSTHSAHCYIIVVAVAAAVVVAVVVVAVVFSVVVVALVVVLSTRCFCRSDNWKAVGSALGG